ncbi:MAG: hypothetical protein JWR41_104, partial [Modestobacter sp.]|nr:hypothetical protein [Modestobacter sp.]
SGDRLARPASRTVRSVAFLLISSGESAMAAG